MSTQQVKPADGTYRVSPPDPRDFKIGSALATMTPANQLPASLDLTKSLQAPRDQGGQSSCVAYSASAMREYYAKNTQSVGYYLSPQFVYDLRPDVSAGYMNPREALNTLSKVGQPPDSVYPEREGDVKVAPDATVIATAAAFKIASYWAIGSVDECKIALNDHGPCIFAVNCWKNAADPARFWVPNPAGDTTTGGHMMTFTGFDDAAGTLMVRNSYGNTWNGNGYTWMPYADWQYVKECWCITAIIPAPQDPLLSPVDPVSPTPGPSPSPSPGPAPSPGPTPGPAPGPLVDPRPFPTPLAPVSPAPAPAPAPRPAPTPKRAAWLDDPRTPVLVAASALALLLVAILVLWLMDNATKPGSTPPVAAVVEAPLFVPADAVLEPAITMDEIRPNANARTNVATNAGTSTNANARTNVATNAGANAGGNARANAKAGTNARTNANTNAYPSVPTDAAASSSVTLNAAT